MKPTFTSKAQYLQWRTDWRAQYKQISHDIRWLRLARSALQSGLSNPKWDSARPGILTIMKKYTGCDGLFRSWEIRRLRQEAQQMLEWRKESKLRAQEQYLAQRQACSSPA